MTVTITYDAADDLELALDSGVAAVEVGNGLTRQVLGDVAVEQAAFDIGVFELAALDEGSLEGGGDGLFFLKDVGEADVVEAGIYATAVEREGIAAALHAQGAALLLEHGEEVLQVGEHTDGLLLDEGGDVETATGHGGGLALLFQAAHFVAGGGIDHAHEGLGGALHKALLYTLGAIDGTAGEPDIEAGGTRR